jgi:hypothetical protein
MIYVGIERVHCLNAYVQPLSHVRQFQDVEFYANDKGNLYQTGPKIRGVLTCGLPNPCPKCISECCTFESLQPTYPACIGAPIILCRWPSLSAHESESMLRTYLVCREKQERERSKQTARGRSTQCTNNNDPITSTSELLLL